MPFQCAEQFAAVPLPQFDRAVKTSAGQDVARRIKGDATDNSLVPFQRAQALARPGIPQPDRPVIRRRRQDARVRRPRDAPDHAPMSPQCAHEFDAPRQLLPHRFIGPAPVCT